MTNKRVARITLHASKLVFGHKTLRQIAKETGWALVTVQRDIQAIKNIDPILYEMAIEQLQKNSINGHKTGALKTNTKRWNSK